MEIFWLITAVLTAVVAGVSLYRVGWQNTDKMFLVFPIIAFGLYWFRKSLRLKEK